MVKSLLSLVPLTSDLDALLLLVLWRLLHQCLVVQPIERPLVVELELGAYLLDLSAGPLLDRRFLELLLLEHWGNTL